MEILKLIFEHTPHTIAIIVFTCLGISWIIKSIRSRRCKGKAKKDTIEKVNG